MTSGSENMFHISFDMLSLDQHSDCEDLRYFRYIDLKNWENCQWYFYFIAFKRGFVDESIGIRVWGSFSSIVNDDFASKMIVYISW